jgi:hypothetical protein
MAIALEFEIRWCFGLFRYASESRSAAGVAAEGLRQSRKTANRDTIMRAWGEEAF